MKPRIMYIESKGGGLTGPARIGRVAFSKSGRTIYYRGQEFRIWMAPASRRTTTTSRPARSTGSPAPRRDGSDRLYGERIPVEIDDDVREEYWTVIRGQRSRVNDPVANR